MKRIVMDLDGTLTVENPMQSYADRQPRSDVVARLKEYKELGFEIVIATARNMKTFNGNVGKINIFTLPAIIEWLDFHSIPYDEIYVGKPWCGHSGFYVDDKAIRPDEFAMLSYDEIALIVNADVQKNG